MYIWTYVHMHLIPHTLIPNCYTLHPTPCTLHPTPYILHPTSYTPISYTPYTLHPLHPTLYILTLHLSIGDTCTVSNTFSGTGYGTVNDAANVVSGNHGTWGAGLSLSLSLSLSLPPSLSLSPSLSPSFPLFLPHPLSQWPWDWGRGIPWSVKVYKSDTSRRG